MPTDTNKGFLHTGDDFQARAINLDLYAVNSDGGTTFAISVAHNGMIRSTGDGTDSDISNLYTPAMWRADAGGPLTLEMRVALHTLLSSGENFIGFSDEATDEEPMSVSTADALTSTAANAAGFCYTGGGTADWKAVSVNAGADGTVTRCNEGGATTPVLDTWQTFKIVINQDGDADFFINGIWQYREDLAVSASTLLNFFLCHVDGGDVRSMDCDYWDVWSARR